jgi:hypothetical protein
MKNALEAKGVTVVGQFVLTQKEVEDEQKTKVLIDSINAANKP